MLEGALLSPVSRQPTVVGFGTKRVTGYSEIDELAGAAAAVLDAANAAVSFVDPADGLSLLSNVHITSDAPGPREFCEHVIATAETLIVNDACSGGSSADAAPLTGPRFYAGLPLVASNGDCLGTLCVFDDRPRSGLTEGQRELLERLARVTARLVESEHARRLAAIRGQVSTVTADDTLVGTVMDNLPVMVFAKDVARREYVLFNKAGEDFTGMASEDVVGRSDEELFPTYASGFRERDDATLAQDTPFEFESEFTGPDGNNLCLRTRRLVVEVPGTGDRLIVGISEDVTEARKAEAELVRMARFDSVTGIANRASLTELLRKLVGKRQPFALISIDLQRFTAINDRLGQMAGDEVLREVADRIKPCLGTFDHLARLGGDDFAVVVVGGPLRARANSISEAIQLAAARPFQTNRGVAHSGASGGIALFPDDGSTPDEIREKANLALHRGKERNHGTFCWFSSDMDYALSDRRALESDLRSAIDNEDIAVWYQPILNASTGQVDSVEALARWNHPLRGVVSPETFVSLAEELDLIERLGELVLTRACVDAAQWPVHLAVSVNLSPAQFQSGALLPIMHAALDASGLDPARLHVEVTEGLVIRDVRRTFDQLEKLRELGIHVHVDDFGVGYSSLSYFERFSFDAVKIDKSFVQSIDSSRSARAIIRAVVGLARELDMDVVAEGIETEAQMRALVEFGCTHLQGFLFSQAIPARSVVPLIERARFCNTADPEQKRYA